MVGKRGIKVKRPAVLCAAAFVGGVASARQFGRISADAPGVMLVGATVLLMILYIRYLRRLQKGRRRVSALDKLLVLAPVFLLLGYLVMNRATGLYERDVATFAECMDGEKEVLAEGVVSHIRLTANGVRLELKDARVASYTDEETAYRSVGDLLVYTDDIMAENGEIKHGQQVFVYGNGSLFEKASNPGGFDAKAYYFSLGITGAIHAKAVRITEASYHRLTQALFQAKNKLLNSYVTYLGEDGAGVISSMLLGERALLSEETENLYRHGGISHILAISGLHVSMIGMALYGCLRKTILGRNGAIPVSCVGVILYGTFVEAGTSTKRAVIMFLLLLLATALGRTYDTLSAMSVSVIAILCQSPGTLYTASFQLSFAAAYGASVLAAVLHETEEAREVIAEARKVAGQVGSKWRKLGEYIVEKIRNLFVFGLVIQAVTFPFTVYHFFEYPTYGFLLNPIVVPLMTILLLCGLLSGVCGLFVPWLGYFFAGGTGGILWIYETLCRLTEKLPCSLLLFGRPTGLQMILYYVLLAVCLFVWLGRRQKGSSRIGIEGHGISQKIRAQKMVLLGLLFLPLCLLPVPGTRFETAFLDVGQGDGIVLREPGGAVLLVDGGSTSIQKVGQKCMIPYLKSQGIRVIDSVLISHTDSDHISGIKEILEGMPAYSRYRESVAGYIGVPVIKSIMLPKLYGEENQETEPDQGCLTLIELAEEKNVTVYYMAAGDRMKVGKELVFTCLAPEEDVLYADKNAASMVLLATYGDFDLLLTGDMDREGEQRLLERNTVLRSVEVLKVAHHGSRTASSEEFVTALQPRISVISCGKDNRYGHPHPETLETLYGANSRVYRTDESGCVTVKVGRNVKVKEFKKEK